MSAAEWDGPAYDRLAYPQEEWGREVLARFRFSGNETVLDAGCGSGRVTRHLLDLLPDGRVIGVDASHSMIETGRKQLAGYGDRIELIVSDLVDLVLPSPVDAIFSNAAFHWILDHERLFARLHAALRSGGVIEAQFGGQDNVAEWQRAIEAAQGDERFSAYLRRTPDVYNFASLGDTEDRLRRTGFEVDRIWLETRSVSPPEPEEFVRTCGLAKHLARLPQELHDEFVDAVLGSMPWPLTLEYVRLNVSARKP